MFTGLWHACGCRVLVIDVCCVHMCLQMLLFCYQGNTGLHHAVSSANHGVMNILMGCEGLDTNCKNRVCNSVELGL